ncbi:MAG: hypothetical protein ACI4VE_06005 [Clostridia bacterium]
MKKKNEVRKRIIKLLILVFVLILLIKMISFTYSKYESRANTKPNIIVAFYVLNKDYQSMNLNLDELFPREEPYIYTFSISNTKGQKRCQTDLEYELSIKTTTNLPITYELYKNQNYNDDNATSIKKTDEIIQDEDGTYFRIITTETESFSFREDETNIYQLVVHFPQEYNTINYQDIIEGIEITVNSKQII